MTKTIPYFQVYAVDFIALTRRVSNEEIIDIFNAISDHCLYGESDYKPSNKFAKTFYEKLLNDLKKNTKKYESSVANGRKGGRPRNNPQVSTGITQTKPRPKATETETETETETKTESKTKNIFVKPSVEDIHTYCNERMNFVDAEKFFNFYESKGWLVGKNKMKDWKACVRTWEKSASNEFTNSKNIDNDKYNKIMNFNLE